MIQLRRPPGQFARVGHRGASALAPENTLAALELAVELGCDMLEFDVLDLVDGTLVLAHSGDLREVSHGAARGRVRRRALADLRQVAPGLPTLDEARASLLRLMNAPLTRLVRTLAEPAAMLARTLKARGDQPPAA